MGRTCALLGLLATFAAGEGIPGRVVDGELPPVKRGGDALVYASYVPLGHDGKTATPLVLAIHGGRGNARQFVGFLRPLAERQKAIVVGPQGFEEIVGADGFWWRDNRAEAEALDRLLEHARATWNIDPKRITLVGLADGAELGLHWALGKDRGLQGVIALNFLWKLSGTMRADKGTRFCLIASADAMEKTERLKDHAARGGQAMTRQKYPVVVRIVPGSSRSFFHRWETEFDKAYEWFGGRLDWPAEIAREEAAREGDGGGED